MSDQVNRRGFTRVPVRVKVKVIGRDHIKIEGQVKNISMKGIFVEANHHFPVGTVCHIELFVNQGKDDIVIETDGKVVRHDKGGMGLQITKVAVDSYEHLHQLVMSNAENQDVIDEELNRQTDAQSKVL